MSKAFKNIARLLDSVEGNIPVNEDFIGDLKRSIELSDIKNTKIPSKTYKPSSMKCLRSMYYQVKGIELEKVASSYCLVGICNSGTDIHIRIQQAVSDMKNNGIDCEYIDVAKFVKDRKLDYLEIKERNASGTETKLYHKDLNISFMCDGIIKYKNHYYILEIKTETSYKWTTRKDVAEEHKTQATTYSLMFNLPDVMFVYVSRDTLDMKCYIYTPTNAEKTDIVGKIELCDECVKNHTLPAKQEDISKTQCSYCAYKQLCDIDYDGGE